MKKIIFIVFLLWAVAAQAQYDTLSYNIGLPWFLQSHPFDSIHALTHDGTSCRPGGGGIGAGGTFHVGDPCYNALWNGICYGLLNYDNPSFTSNIFGATNQLFLHYEYESGADLAFGFYPDSTIHLIGLAMHTISGRPTGDDGIGQWDTNWFDSVVVKVYTPMGSDMTLSAIASIGKTDMVQDRYYYMVTRGWNGRDSGNFDVIEYGSFLREVYFENEIDISDSLYISVKHRSANNNYWNENTTGWIENHTQNITPEILIYPVQSYRLRHCEECPWIYGEQHSYPFLFPIIRRDCDSCPQVRGLQFIKSGTRKAFFRWNMGVNHHDWQLSYGPAGTAPEDGTTLEYDGRQSGLIEFDPDSHYVVYVRARCRFARDEYGPWSDPLNFCLNGNGIDEADAAGLTLTPNPTSGKVTVGCGMGIRQMTVFNAAGVQVHTEAIGGSTSATIDTKGWPAGQYVVTVETAAGTVSKVLTVTR